MNQFHFLRIEWLFALLPLLLFFWLVKNHQHQSKSWQKYCDKNLLPHLFSQELTSQSRYSAYFLLLAGSLIITALAGPTWEKLPQPVFKQQSALVIALDLSRSMDSNDIKPSRLARALLKVEDILQKRKEGQTALIVYAGSAFTVTPLTEDNKTISSQIKSLSTDIMPDQGSRADRAIDLAYELFKRSSQVSGHIVLISDGISQQSLEHIKKNRNSAYSLSVLGVGTLEGAPIPLKSGGFFNDKNGTIVIPKLNADMLQQLAVIGGGSFRFLSVNDNDIQVLLSPLDRFSNQSNSKSTELNTDTWLEMGPWLLLLVLPLAAFAFRRGYLFIILIFILPLPQPASANELNSLWKNNNQQALVLLKQDKASEAAQLFSDKKWQAAAEYKAGNYQAALDLYTQLDKQDLDTQYNMANALAQTGQLDKALSMYNKIIENNANHSDAIYNRDLIEKLKQQQAPQQNDSNNDKKNKDKQDKKQQEQQQQSNKQQSADSQQQDSDSQNNDDNSATDTGDKSNDNNTDTDANQHDKDSKKQTNKTDNKDSDQNEQQTQQQNNTSSDKSKQTQPEDNTSPSESTALSKEQQQANQQWLRKIPDNPGGLLKRKFQYQTQQRQENSSGEQQW